VTLKRIPTDSKDIQLIQDAVDTALIPLQQGLMATALTINNVALVSGQDNLIPHLKVNSVVWSPDTASLSGSNWDSTRINLRCSTSCTITLWVN
jgi:hypothetical protein